MPMTLILYFMEMIKYYLANKLIFDNKMKRRLWLVFPLTTLPFCIFMFMGKTYVDVYIGAYIFSCIACIFMFEGKIGIRIFRALSLLCILICIDAVAGILFLHFANSSYSLGLKSLIESLITIGLLLLLNTINIYKKYDFTNFNFVTKAISLSIVCMILCLACTVGGLLYAQKYLTNDRKIYLSIAGVISYGCIVSLIIFVLYIKKTNEKLGVLIETERELKQMQGKYYEALLEREENTRQYRHDMNNHLLCLREFANKKNIVATLEYINELQGELAEIQKKCYLTGNDILDIILNYYLLNLNDTEITVSGKCCNYLQISNVDFCIIISNAIQNAVEEVKRTCVHKKYIRIKIKQGNTFISIEIRNNSDLVKSKEQVMIDTKKTNKENHGFGLRNIEKTVKKNGGSFYLSGDGKEAAVEIILRHIEEPFI